jgi:cytochrome bd ubiquinol oxidase subunit I
MEQEGLHAARVLMGDSLGFHIIFVMFGLTLPILVSIFEFMGIRKKDQKLLAIAKFWSKIMTVLVITGVVSGTIIALQMSLVWPGILKFGGEVIGLPFLFETYAFLIEAVFLALYMATWNSKRIKPWLHWIFGLFIILGGTLSAYAITSVNAWMNLPSGFDYVDGKLVNINVWEAIFSQTALIEFIHSMPAYYFASVLTIAGLYIIKILHSKTKARFTDKHTYDWFIVHRLMIFAAILFVILGATADITGKYLAKHEPSKLAAIELRYETGPNASMLLGGVAGDNDTVSGPHIKIPALLSILAGNSPNYVVVGLDQVPRDERPPLYVHTLFNIKMILVTFIGIMLVSYFTLWYKWPELRRQKWFLLPLTTLGVLAIILVELGWMLTEIGRQPWSVRGFVTTTEALTKTHDITTFGYLFPLSYVALFAVTILAIRKLIKLEFQNKGETYR